MLFYGVKIDILFFTELNIPFESRGIFFVVTYEKKKKKELIYDMCFSKTGTLYMASSH